MPPWRKPGRGGQRGRCAAAPDGSLPCWPGMGKPCAWRGPRSSDAISLAKRAEGPALIVADRMDAIVEQLRKEGLGDQFIRPTPAWSRHTMWSKSSWSDARIRIRCIPGISRRTYSPADLDVIGRRYVGRVADEIAKTPRALPTGAGGVASGGVDSGLVARTTYQVMRQMGMNPARLKAFTLNFGDGPDSRSGAGVLDSSPGMFLEEIHADVAELGFC